MGTIHNLRNSPPEVHIQKENPVTSNSRSIKERFIDLLNGYTKSQKQYVDSFFSQGSDTDKIEDFLSTCSHREFYEFIEGSPGLQRAFLYKFKECKFGITREDMIYFMKQMKLFEINE